MIGAGSIGSLFAGHLAQVADVSVLTRRRSTPTRSGARRAAHHGASDLHAAVDARRATRTSSPPFDLGIVATKAAGLEDAAAALEGHFPDATVMTTLNGLGAEEVVRAHGDWPIVSAVTFMSGTKHSDTRGRVHPRHGDVDRAVRGHAVRAGSRRSGRSSRVRARRPRCCADLRPAQWSKLIFNATVNSVAALTGLRHDPHFAAEESPTDLGHLVHDLVDEGKAVAAAAGVELHDDPWEMNVLATQRGSAHYPSMLEDVEARRPTEIDLITGALVREAGASRGAGATAHGAVPARQGEGGVLVVISRVTTVKPHPGGVE